ETSPLPLHDALPIGDVVGEPDRDADRRRHPQAGGRGEAVHGAARLQDRAAADEADAGDDLRRDAAAIPGAAPGAGAAAGPRLPREMRQQGGADGHQHVGAQTGPLAGPFALGADRAGEEGRERDLEPDLGELVHEEPVMPEVPPAPPCDTGAAVFCRTAGSAPSTSQMKISTMRPPTTREVSR